MEVRQAEARAGQDEVLRVLKTVLYSWPLHATRSSDTGRYLNVPVALGGCPAAARWCHGHISTPYGLQRPLRDEFLDEQHRKKGTDHEG